MFFVSFGRACLQHVDNDVFVLPVDEVDSSGHHFAVIEVQDNHTVLEFL